ncbi:MAG: hypothetical protein AB1607_18920 [Chloroflexota bacterium]
MTLATYITIPYRGRQEESAKDFLSSTDGVQGVNPAELYEQGKPINTVALRLMIASQNVLAKDWDRPEEDAAWAYLSKGK